MTAHIRLRQFDVATMKPSSTIVMIGMCNTGKTFLVRDLLKHNQSIPHGTIISGLLEPIYKNITPPADIYDTYTPELVGEIVKHQKNRNDADPRTFLVLDDCIYDNEWTKDTAIRNLYMHSCTLNTMFIVTMRYVMWIPPTLRASIDYVFILRERLLPNQRRLYEQFVATITDFDTFLEILNDICDREFECLVIDNTGRSSSLEDTIFWYKAAAPDRMRLLSQ